MWCWRKLLRVPWAARRSNQSILKEVSPEYSLEGLMLKLKLQYFGHLMWRTDSHEKTLILGKIEGRRTRGRQSIWCLDGKTEVMDLSMDKLCVLVIQGSLACCRPWGRKDLEATKWLNWTWNKMYSSSGLLCIGMGFPGGIVLKNLPASARDTRDLVSVRGLGRSPGLRNGNLL